MLSEKIYSFLIFLWLISLETVEMSQEVDRTDIFCKGPLLHTIQMAKIFEDSKTFVDMKMKHSPIKILEKYHSFMKKYQNNPSRHQVKQFVIHNFDKNNEEFRKWHPTDWKEKPSFLNNVTHKTYKNFGHALNKIWKVLGRKVKSAVKKEKELYSLIWVPNPVIVPGGRFREFYYWDSYWIVKGLIISEMFETVKGMLENYLYIVDNFGYIPNGGRIYYLGRSQPPLLIPSFKDYMDATNDIEFLNKSINTLDQEFEFWVKYRMKTVSYDGEEYLLATYNDLSTGPRPESYAEDVELADKFKDNEEKLEFYREVKSAAESGWDFSSRWFIYNKTNKGSLEDVKASYIVPVDLNAILYGNALILSQFYKQLQNEEKALHYSVTAQNLLNAVNKVLWHEEVGTWLDYDLANGVKRDYFYASNLAPLWTGCYDKHKEEEIVNLNLKYLENKHIFHFPGGIPQSLEHTGEQWDYPNAWSPSQHIIIFGLKRTNNAEAQKLAKELAVKWIASNYQAFVKMKHMAEKYDATVTGESGGGGEYRVQYGFGWTNGVILDIIVNYFSN